MLFYIFTSASCAADNNGGCDGICHDISPGKVYCSCPVGLKLADNNAECVGKMLAAEESSFLVKYWSSSHILILLITLLKEPCQKISSSFISFYFAVKFANKPTNGPMFYWHQLATGLEWLFTCLIPNNLFTFTATDIDECAGTNPCSDTCVNTVGSFTCTCSGKGDRISPDGVTCTGKSTRRVLALGGFYVFSEFCSGKCFSTNMFFSENILYLVRIQLFETITKSVLRGEATLVTLTNICIDYNFIQSSFITLAPFDKLNKKTMPCILIAFKRAQTLKKF